MLHVGMSRALASVLRTRQERATGHPSRTHRAGFDCTLTALAHLIDQQHAPGPHFSHCFLDSLSLAPCRSSAVRVTAGANRSHLVVAPYN
jgi:hypothetical protein